MKNARIFFRRVYLFGKEGIIVRMKRFIALIGALSLTVGIRLWANGLLNCGYSGTLSVGTYDTERTEVPLLIDGPHRLDIAGDEETAYDVISNLDGKVLMEENLSDMKIIYAYSPRLMSPVIVHSMRVNLMIAVSDRGVTAGTPLIYGSY